MAEPVPKRIESLEELEEEAVRVARFLHSKKAEDVLVLRVRELLPISSYFVLASAPAARANRALADGTERLLKPQPLPCLGVHGRDEGRWICLDHGELVVHLFDRDARKFYDLENLWADAPRVPVELAGED